jgi:hypothetical protein
MWKIFKLQHKYNKLLFVLLKRIVTNDFFKGKICMNPSKDPPSNEFNEVFEHWISRFANKDSQMGLMCFELHYTVDLLLELDNLKDIVDDCSRNVNFMNNKLGRTFVVFSTMNSLNKDLDIYFFTYWKSVLSSLLSKKVAFKTIVYIYKQKFFNNLVIIL